MDDPLTVIVLTNLDTESGRHPKLLATAIAGAWRQRYAPPHALAPATDPNPSVTKTIEAFLGDISARRKSSAMSGAYRAWYNSELGSRVWMSTQLAGTAPLRYLAHDDLAGRSLWQREPLDRLVHYATDVKGRPTYLSVGLTRDGSIGALDFYGR
jgi:hypothetical protein